MHCVSLLLFCFVFSSRCEDLGRNEEADDVVIASTATATSSSSSFVAGIEEEEEEENAMTNIVNEVLMLHTFHFNEHYRPVYCNPLGEILFHASHNSSLMTKEQREELVLTVSAPPREWTVTVTEVKIKGARLRCLYTNFILEGVVECLPDPTIERSNLAARSLSSSSSSSATTSSTSSENNGDGGKKENEEQSYDLGCLRADPPSPTAYLDTMIAATFLGLFVRKDEFQGQLISPWRLNSDVKSNSKPSKNANEEESDLFDEFMNGDNNNNHQKSDPIEAEKRQAESPRCKTRILLGGLGTGLIPNYFQRVFADHCLVVVEILPAVLEATTSDLGVVIDNEQTIVKIDDFVDVLSRDSPFKYDLVIGDISGNDASGARMLPPPSLMSEEFLRNVWKKLTERGLYIQHLWKVRYSLSTFSLFTRRIARVFPTYFLLDADSSWIVIAPKQKSVGDELEDISLVINHVRRSLAKWKKETLNEDNGEQVEWISSEVRRITNKLGRQWRRHQLPMDIIYSLEEAKKIAEKEGLLGEEGVDSVLSRIDLVVERAVDARLSPPAPPAPPAEVTNEKQIEQQQQQT